MPKLTPFPRGASQHTPRSEFGKCQKDSNYKAWRPDQLRILKSWTSSCLLGCCRVGHAIAFLPKVKYMIGHGKGDTVRRECGITRSILITLGTGIGSAFAVTGNWFRTRNWATCKSMGTTLKATPQPLPWKEPACGGPDTASCRSTTSPTSSSCSPRTGHRRRRHLAVGTHHDGFEFQREEDRCGRPRIWGQTLGATRHGTRWSSYWLKRQLPGLESPRFESCLNLSVAPCLLTLGCSRRCRNSGCGSPSRVNRACTPYESDGAAIPWCLFLLCGHTLFFEPAENGFGVGADGGHWLQPGYPAR